MAASVSSVLQLAAERLSRTGAWTQHATARDFAGREVEGSDKVAMSWCICAAVDVEAAGLGEYDRALEPLGGDKAAIDFNDALERTQEEVVAFVLRGSRVSAMEPA